MPRGHSEYHTPEPVTEIMERLSMPIPECGCFMWLGKLGTHGYAYVSYRVGDPISGNRKRICRKAATVALEMVRGPRPKGLEVHHLCYMEWCVNPDHLVWATRSQNSADRRPYRWVLNCPHCNTPKEMIGSEWGCRECNAKRAAEWRERTGYDQNKYREQNKDRINAQRRERRRKAKEVS